MSLGGFAQGLATAFQKAEDRYQDKIEREQARADRLAAQTAGHAFTEKMYKLRREDDYRDKIADRYAQLSGLFGSDEKGKLLTAAFMPFDIESTRATVNDFKAKVKGTGIDFRNYMEVSNPEGSPENYSAKDLPSLPDITSAFVDRKKGKIPEGFSLPSISYLEVPIFDDKRTDLGVDVTDDPYENMINLQLEIKERQVDIQSNNPRIKTQAEKELKLLKGLLDAEKVKAENLVGQDFDKSGHLNWIGSTINSYKNKLFGDKYKPIYEAGQLVSIRIEGNVTDILDTYEFGYNNRVEVLNNFKGSKSLYAQGAYRFNSDYVVAGNAFLRDSINKATNETFKLRTNPLNKKEKIQGTGPIKINMVNPTADDFRAIQTLGKGDVYIPIVTVGGVKTELDVEMIKAINQPTKNNKTGIEVYREFSSITPVIGK